MTDLAHPFGPAGRFREVLVGSVALIAAAGFGYFGASGAWMYLHGSRAAPADPRAAAIGIATCIWITYVGVRLLRGGHREQPLLPNAVLLTASVASLLAGIWFVFTAIHLAESWPEVAQTFVAFVAAGGAGLVLWWRRIRSRRREMLPNEEL